MAVIIQDDAQLKALEDINRMLDELRGLNLAIKNGEPYLIRVNKKQMIAVDENLSARIETVLRIQRDRRIKDIASKAQKYRISLNAEEQALLHEEQDKSPCDDEQ